MRQYSTHYHRNFDEETHHSKQTGIRQVAIAGGVSANTGLHKAMHKAAEEHKWEIYIPKLSYSTDNAAMIAVAGFFKYRQKQFARHDITPYARQSNKK